MSAAGPAPMNSNTDDEAHTSPEKTSMQYEPLFDDDTINDTPCYLPDKAQIDLSPSAHSNGNQEAELETAGRPSNAPAEQHNPLENLTFLTEELDRPACEGQKESGESADSSSGAEVLEEEASGTSHDVDDTDSKPIVQIEELDQKTEDERLQERASSDESGFQVPENGNIQEASSEVLPEIASTSGEISASYSENGGEEPWLSQTNVTQNLDARPTNLIPGKQHQDEDDTNTSWRKHKKHYFILSHAGKPIYSRYGDEHKLAGFSATLQAIISFIENSGDCVRFIRAGDHQIVFLVKGPIYLVSISATDEPVQALRGQLELLYGQLLLILTKSLEKCFVKNANFDMRPLLGGTEFVFSSLISSFSWNPATFLHSYTCLPLSHNARQAAGAALQDVADSDLLFALLLSNSKVISLVGAQKASLHPDDILLLSSFVSASESFRTTESYSPVCLPNYNPMAFLYAYVHYLDTDTCLILITANSDAFFHLKECRVKIESFLLETHVLSEIANSVQKGGLKVEDLPGDALYGSLGGGRRVENRISQIDGGGKQTAGVGGAGGLWHFIYRSVYLDQYVASEYSPPLHTKPAQKRLFRAYQRMYASMHGGSAGSHQMQYRRDESHVLLGWSTADFEFFAAFDPLAEKSSAITICNRVCQWIRDLESDIFYLGASPFNW